MRFDAGEAPFELSADSVEYDRARDLYVADGNVEIRQGDRRLTADWIAFSNTTQKGVASGSVAFSEDGETLHTAFAEFDIVTMQGVLYDASLEASKGQYRMSGQEIAKTGRETYRFERGRFTTCRCPPGEREPWEIKAESAQLEVGGYGTARNTTFEVLGVPVAWLPWAIYPLKTERQTGLLFPLLSVGSIQGFAIAQPFFWAARENVNVLLTPGWSVKRGFSVQAESEYLLGEDSAGNVAAAYHHDEDIDPHTLSEPFGRDRWATWGRQDFALPGEVRAKSDVVVSSDNQYPSDFPELGAYRSDRFLQSRAFAQKNFGEDGRYGLIGGISYADDIQSPDNQDRDRFLLQRLPELAFTVLPAPTSFSERLVPSLDAGFVYFRSDVSGNDLFRDTGIDARFNGQEYGLENPAEAPDPDADLNEDNFDMGVVSGTEANGLFEEGEPLPNRGQRGSLTPRLGVPLRLGNYAELYPEVGWSQVLYDSDATGFEQRGFATANVELRTRLRRRFGDSVTHLMEPRFGYALVTDTSQSDNPLFVPRAAVEQRRLRELDLRNVTRDPADRVPEFNGFTLAVANRFWGRMGEESAPRFLGDATVSAQYDAAGDDFGLLLLDGHAFPLERTTLRANFGFDPEKARVEEALLEAAQAFEPGHRIGLRYRYLRDIPDFFETFRYVRERFRDVKTDFDRVSQIDLYGRYSITDSWAITYLGSYSFERSLVLRNLGGIEYWSRCKCWAVRLEIAQDRERGVNFSLQYTLTGLGDGGVRPYEPSGVPGFESVDGT